jgi:hypothetical protein
MAYDTSQPCGSLNRQPPMQMPMQMPMTHPGGFTVQQPLPGMPSGFATGPTTTPVLPTPAGLPAFPTSEQPPTTVQSTLFTPGFLRTQIGKRMRIEFLIGTGVLTDRTGTLLAVGASYVLIRPVGTNETMLCDIYSIKFVTILD